MHTHRNQLFARCWQSCFYYCVCHILFSFFLSAVTRLHKLQRLILLRSFLFFASHKKIAAQWPWFRKSGQGFNRRTLQPTCQKNWPPIALGGCSIGVRLEKLCIIAVHLAFHTQLGCIHNLHTVGMLIFVLTAVQTSRRVLYLHVWHL